MKRIAIIGGGASGLAAAVAATRALRSMRAHDEVEVVVYEADDRVGRTILATGNGRCNFSNARPDASRYRNAPFVAAACRELTCQGGEGAEESMPHDPVHAFFLELGLAWREESEGRLYPLANKASSVLDVLRAAASEGGAREACGRRAVRIDAPTREGERYHLRFSDGAVEHAQSVVVAVGGKAIGRLGLPSGLSCTPGAPVLGPLATSSDIPRRLNNIRVRCEVALVDADGAAKGTERGEVLFRSYGVSGIAVFNLSRLASPGDALRIDLVPAIPAGEMEGYLRARRRRLAAGCGAEAVSGERLLCGLLLPQVAEEVLQQAALQRSHPIAERDLPALATALKGLTLEVRGIGDARQCQVTRGGLDPASFDASTMGARGMGGLYAAGEALDVDGPCGGYNLHWAWASGMLAGRAAARAAAGAAQGRRGDA